MGLPRPDFIGARNDGLKVCPRNEVKEGVEEGTCSLLGKKNPTLRGEGAGGEG